MDYEYSETIFNGMFLVNSTQPTSLQNKYMSIEKVLIILSVLK